MSSDAKRFWKELHVVAAAVLACFLLASWRVGNLEVVLGAGWLTWYLLSLVGGFCLLVAWEFLQWLRE